MGPDDRSEWFEDTTKPVWVAVAPHANRMRKRPVKVDASVRSDDYGICGRGFLAHEFDGIVQIITTSTL